jgi:DNA mismatch repair ATPase MutL
MQDKQDYVKLVMGAGNMVNYTMEQAALKYFVKNDVADMVKMVPEKNDLGVDSALAEYVMDHMKVPKAARSNWWLEMKNCSLVVRTLRSKLNSNTCAFKKKYQRESHG